MRILIGLGFVLSLWFTPAAQSINEDPAITKMMEEFVKYNRTHQKVRGWRVQVAVTTDRRQVESARNKFEEIYPDYPLLFNHENPFYHLKTGAFMTQSDARPFLASLQEEFPNAFIVSDEIDVSEVLIYQKDL